MNFAGVFWVATRWPGAHEGHVEEKRVNNTLAPYKTCTSDSTKGDRGVGCARKSIEVYLRGVRERMGGLLDGMRLDYEDVYIIQLLCAYEVRHRIFFLLR